MPAQKDNRLHIWLKAYPGNVDYFAPIESAPLFELLDRAADSWPDNPAIDFLGKTFTYREIRALANRVAAGLQKLGVGKGVNVGLFLPNCPHFVACYYGILKAGGTVVNYSPLYSEPELEHQIEDSHTDIMVTLGLEALYPKMRNLLPKTRLKKLVVGTLHEMLPFPKNLLFPLVKRKEISSVPSDEHHVSFKALTANDGTFEPREVTPEEDVAVLQYTGGTTGVSKGAMLTHANLFANSMQARLWFGDTKPGEERVLGVLPFFHVFAMTSVMNNSINMGAEIVMHPRFVLEDALKDITKKKITMMAGVPTMYLAMANHPEISKYDLSSMEACISGGAPLPVEVKQKFENIGKTTVVEGYGLTESSPIACCNPFEGANKPGSIGLPMPGTEIKIFDPEDPKKEMPQGEPGELCIKGPQVMAGYWNRPEATAKTIIDGYLHTGDIAYLDEDGYAFIIDRIKDLIIAGGFNIYPRTVEEAIYQHPSVAEVTVIGVPDDYLGEAVKAFVKLKPGAPPVDEAGLIAFLREKIGKHEIPREVEFRDELPKTLIGKLSKKELVAEEKEKYARRKEAEKASA